MKRLLMFLVLILFSTAFSKEKITKEQFCHFSYSIYQACYKRGNVPGVDCGKLSKGIKFGKGFNKNQIKYIQNVCKTACFLGKNKFKPQNKDKFINDCLK